VRVDTNLFKKMVNFSKTKQTSKSEMCRRILNDYFSKQKYETIEVLSDKLESVIPNLEQHAKEYVAMKEVLKETVTTMYESMSDIKEMKKGHFLTYKTLQSQKEVFEKLIASLSGK